MDRPTTAQAYMDRLPFPTRVVQTPLGPVEEYLIPEERKAEVLEWLYPFVGVPPLDAVMIDIHEDRPFVVRDYRVTREDGSNWLVSPYYFLSGGTVIDWWPADPDDPGLLSLDD